MIRRDGWYKRRGDVGTRLPRVNLKEKREKKKKKKKSQSLPRNVSAQNRGLTIYVSSSCLIVSLLLNLERLTNVFICVFALPGSTRHSLSRSLSVSPLSFPLGAPPSIERRAMDPIQQVIQKYIYSFVLFSLDNNFRI